MHEAMINVTHSVMRMVICSLVVVDHDIMYTLWRARPCENTTFFTASRTL